MTARTPLIYCLALLLNAGLSIGMCCACDELENSPRQQQGKKDKEKDPVDVCPLMLFANHGEYATYYAIRCETAPSYVSLDSIVDSQLGPCTHSDCVPVSTHWLPPKHAVSRRFSERGLAKFGETTQLAQGATQVRQEIICFDITGGETITANTMLIRVDPAKFATPRPDPVQEFGIGYQIRPVGDVRKIPNAAEVGRCCYHLRIGGHEYQIIIRDRSPHESLLKEERAAAP